jgi:hypothetical protein
VRTFAHICAALLFAAPAFAQIHVQVTAPRPPRVVVHAPAPPRVVVQAPSVHVRPPAIHFVAPPPLVVVRPGIQVVADYDREIYFSHGWYWYCSPGGHWWRARNHRGHWVSAPPRVVPVAVVHLPRGHYRHYHAGKHHRHWERADRHDHRGRGRRG